MRLTETCARWKESGASPEECMSILLPIAEALGSLKVVVGCSDWLLLHPSGVDVRVIGSLLAEWG